MLLSAKWCTHAAMHRKITSLTVLPVCKIFLNRIHQHYLGNNSVDAGRGGEIWFHVINISWNLDIFTNFIWHLIEKPAVVNSIDWWTDLKLNYFKNCLVPDPIQTRVWGRLRPQNFEKKIFQLYLMLLNSRSFQVNCSSINFLVMYTKI